MHKSKLVLLKIAVLTLFAGFAVAAPQPAFKDLAVASPDLSVLENITAEKIEPPLLLLSEKKIIEPGRNLAPRVEDAQRIQAILKLVSDVYYGKPLPYNQDGSVFTNRENRLPARPKGYYREYTLLTGNAPHTVVIDGKTYKVAPDLSARGSERVIIGGGEFLYYTPDHYVNFIQLTVIR